MPTIKAGSRIGIPHLAVGPDVKSGGGRVEPVVMPTDGITNYLERGGTLEKAQAMASHESPKTTKLYDRSADQIKLDEVERIAI